jgi:hypothetical protein
MHKFSEKSPYFCERYDATSCAGLTVLQKYTAALRQLAYGMAAYMIDEYLKSGRTCCPQLNYEMVRLLAAKVYRCSLY